MEREKNLPNQGPASSRITRRFTCSAAAKPPFLRISGPAQGHPPGQSVHGGPGVGAPRQGGIPGGEFLQLG